MENSNVTTLVPKEKSKGEDNSFVSSLSPREIVSELDRYVVGQNKAKRAVAIALRNRWRRQALEGEMKDEVLPKNILMIGPTGVGKTEISRRLSKLAQAPFVKVEATRFTEVGYVGRDVEQIVRDLLEIAIAMGKEVGDDLSEGKITLPMIYALEKTSGSENKILRDAIKTADASNIDKIINILCSVNAFEFTRKIAENESQKALKSLKNIPDSEYRSALKLLCELSLNRKS